MMNTNTGSKSLTISGKSYEDVREKLYSMYGTNYKIENEKTSLKGGFLGLFSKKQITVYYRVLTGESETLQEKSEPVSKLSSSDIALAASIKKEGQNISQMFQQLQYQMEEIKSNTSQNVHSSIQKIEELLLENEFPHSYVSFISSKIKKELSLDKLNDFDYVQKKVVDYIGESISIAPQMYSKLPHIIVLVGPTGVGKTTTLSKLAAGLIINAKKEGRTPPVIRLITIDHTRVGAEEQLRKFGDLMYVKVEKAESAEDLSQIIKNCRDCVDYILIDSSGYSPNDYKNIANMREILNLPENLLDTYLVVAASTKASDLVKIIDNFSSFSFNSVIVTKCDETISYGNILGVLHEKNKAISYITNGQKVPRDIKRATVLDFLRSLSGFNLDMDYITDKFPEEN